jgi:hypothetical protein
MNPHKYLIRRASAAPKPSPDWHGSAWQKAETAEVGNFRSESSVHRPRTSARLLFDNAGVHGSFRVEDQFVRCTRTNYLDDMWKDSCVEFFVQPKPGAGYFNLEMNCGGAFLCLYITDPTRLPNGAGLKSFVKVPPEIGKLIGVKSTLPRTVEPEMQQAVTWELKFFVPFGVFEHFVGPLGTPSGQVWRGNFFKCGDETSHPHWASWSPVDELNFHLPRCFGELQFEETV